MYYLALNHGSEGWSLHEFATLTEIKETIQKGDTFGNPFKVLKELELEIKIEE